MRKLFHGKLTYAWFFTENANDAMEKHTVVNAFAEAASFNKLGIKGSMEVMVDDAAATSVCLLFQSSSVLLQGLASPTYIRLTSSIHISRIWCGLRRTSVFIARCCSAL